MTPVSRDKLEEALCVLKGLGLDYGSTFSMLQAIVDRGRVYSGTSTPNWFERHILRVDVVYGEARFFPYQIYIASDNLPTDSGANMDLFVSELMHEAMHLSFDTGFLLDVLGITHREEDRILALAQKMKQKSKKTLYCCNPQTGHHTTRMVNDWERLLHNCGCKSSTTCPPGYVLTGTR